MEKPEIVPDPIPVGKIPSGIFIVTVADGDQREGFLASWIQQVSFEPLMVSLSLNPARVAVDLLRRTHRFCINIIGQENNGVLKPFWGGLKPGVNPLDLVPHFISGRGNVILTDALAVLECQPKDFIQPGDHLVVFGLVLETKMLKTEDKPMTHIRKTGSSY